MSTRSSSSRSSNGRKGSGSRRYALLDPPAQQCFALLLHAPDLRSRRSCQGHTSRSRAWSWGTAFARRASTPPPSRRAFLQTQCCCCTKNSPPPLPSSSSSSPQASEAPPRCCVPYYPGSSPWLLSLLGVHFVGGDRGGVVFVTPHGESRRAGSVQARGSPDENLPTPHLSNPDCRVPCTTHQQQINQQMYPSIKARRAHYFSAGASEQYRKQTKPPSVGMVMVSWTSPATKAS